MKKFLEITKDTHRAKEYFENELAYTLGPWQLNHLIKNHLDEFNLIDVREYEDYIKAHIPYATHIPCDQVQEQMLQVSKDKVNIVYSYNVVCHKSKKFAYLLANKGYPVMELTGGFKMWKKHDFEIIEDDVSNYPG